VNEARIRAYLAQATSDQKSHILGLLDELKSSENRERCQSEFIPFVRHTWDEFIESAHHRVTADAFERVVNGKLKRLIINMAPRHTKSEFASHYLPAWFLGRNPKKMVIQCSNIGDLAKDFGRKVRDLVDSPEYQEIFPGVGLKADSKAAGKWNTNHRGEYYAVGINGRVTGRGADLLIIDDPHDEQEAALGDPETYDKTYKYYTSGPRQRLQPGGAIIIVMTRWHKRDLTGRVLKESMEREDSDQWELIELPAILHEGTENEKAIWPGFWSLEELRATRATLPTQNWQAQYQQKPTSEEGAILKRDWWKLWEGKDPPKVEFTLQSWDTAMLSREASDFSARTDWGVWHDDDGEANVILLDAFRARMDFVDLKERAYKDYMRVKPDVFIVEQKAAGIPLTSELRQRGIIVSEFTPSRGNDKRVRANQVAPLFSDGRVWRPNTRWAEEVVEECAEFPFGEHDDYVDTVTQALIRIRQGGLISLLDDYEPDEPIFTSPGRDRSTSGLYY
jgi:predicted phage terminase large subunit-like protein